MPASWIHALLGGALIGVAAALLLLVHGRIAGICGIVAGLPRPDRAYRIWFLVGLCGAGLVAAFVAPGAIGASPRSTPGLIVAGLLVGYGTRLGNGCTSGHGVCGLARFSGRSLAAVLTFMATGMITAYLVGL